MKCFYPKFFSIMCVLCFIWSCGPQKISTKSTAQMANRTDTVMSQSSGAVQTLSTIGTETVPTQVDLIHDENVIQRWKNQILFLNSEALEKAYCPVFCSTQECGVSWESRNQCKPRYRASLPSTSYFRSYQSAFFSDQEKIALGDYRISKYDPKFNRMRWMSNVTQDYVKTIRVFLGDACEQLISSEIDASLYDNNVLVKGPSPTVNDINELMSRFFGYKPTSGVHVGAEKYHQVFLSTMTDPPPSSSADRNNRMKVNYLLLCVAVGSDPRVYSR